MKRVESSGTSTRARTVVNRARGHNSCNSSMLRPDLDEWKKSLKKKPIWATLPCQSSFVVHIAGPILATYTARMRQHPSWKLFQ
ncbi:unnamed protein product [Prunus armeniaca]